PDLTKRRAVDDRVRHNLRQPAAEVRRLEHILKDPANVFPGAFVRVKAERSMTKIQWPNVIKSENVIGMTVRDEDRIEVFQADFQGLLAKVTGRIDNDRIAVMFDMDRNAKALVAWIVGSARLAIA